MASPRPRGAPRGALTEADLHAYSAIGIPPTVPLDAAPGSQFSSMLRARLHQLEAPHADGGAGHPSLASLDVATLRWLAERRGVALPARFAGAASAPEVRTLAAFLHQAFERQDKGDSTMDSRVVRSGSGSSSGTSSSSSYNFKSIIISFN